VTAPGAGVVIACHTEDRYALLVRAIGSARAQTPAPAQVIVAVDHNDALAARLRAEVEGIEVIDHRGDRGASGARNAGAALADTPLLAFLDDDVVAHPGWLAALLAPFADPHVVGSGGHTDPEWEGPRPSWFPDEFGWVVGASHAGLPAAVAPVRNVWSENMAVRREAFASVGGFRSGFGKVGNTSRPEDTDFCIRVAAGTPGSHWVYVPAAVVDHVVPLRRSTFAFFVRRCYAEGAGKIELSAHLGDDSDLGDERRYLLRTLPVAFLRDLVTRRWARAGAALVGVAAAGAGAAVALVRRVAARSSR
jgi:GT2 family glycosyltransferase